MGRVTNGKVLTIGAVEVHLPIFRPPDAEVQGVLVNTMAVTRGDEFDVICIEEAI